MINSNEVIFFHEDFYRQVELIPEENYFDTARTISELPVKDEAIFGFNSMIVRRTEQIKLLERRLKFQEIGNVLSPLSLFYSENVASGYGSSVEKIKDAVVWGFEKIGIFVKSEKEFVEAIWMCSNLTFPQENTCSNLASAVALLCKKYSLILIDWDLEIICRSSSIEKAKQYFVKNYSFDS